MISYIRGTLAEVQGDMIVVSAGAVGVNIHVPLSVVETLPPVGKEVMIYTYLKVAEDALTLYGFNTRRDLEMFRQLLNVSGVSTERTASAPFGPTPLTLSSCRNISRSLRVLKP